MSLDHSFTVAEPSFEALVVKDGHAFACSTRDGNMHKGSHDGFFVDDTRFLSTLNLRMGAFEPILLGSSDDTGYSAHVYLANRPGRGIPEMTISVNRTRVVCDNCLHERIELHNFGGTIARTTMILDMAADFLDLFEVRGARVHPGRTHLPPTANSRQVFFSYRGLDNTSRYTTLNAAPMPIWTLGTTDAQACWNIAIEPHGSVCVEIAVTAAYEPESFCVRDVDEVESDMDQRARLWESESTRVKTHNGLFDKAVDTAKSDLRALDTSFDPGRIVCAGIPWYVACFGRDALITSYETLLLRPALARDALLFLASLQATQTDPTRDAEPGKIPHELRRGELARAALVPHTPYYGSVDATPLFLILAAEYYRWTQDVDLILSLIPTMESCLRWIDEHGDLDGDGFVEYQRRAPGGLVNQGWKDSFDAIVHADGSLAAGPIALCEVQGYVYMAKMAMANLFRSLGKQDRSARLAAEAKRLRDKFQDAFWIPEIGFYALALDGNKRQVASVTSNPGHCLFSGIVPDDRAPEVVARLMASEMFTGWGIRTLTSESPAYNPMSYHNGSVWPHDNALIAVGFERYGFHDQAQRLITAMFEASLVMQEVRLPELFCGFPRVAGRPYVEYPAACSPQAWAAGAVFLMLQTMLDITPERLDSSVEGPAPSVPTWLGQIELQNVLLADGRREKLTFERV